MSEFLKHVPLPAGMSLLKSPGFVFREGFDINLYNKSKYIGVLSYLEGVGQEPNELLFISTRHHQRQGLSRYLIQAFINEVGHGKLVTSGIIHKDTWTTLRNMGLLHDAYYSGSISIPNEAILRDLPIIKVLQSGGIQVDLLRIKHRSDRPENYETLLAKIDANTGKYMDFFDTRIEGKT